MLLQELSLESNIGGGKTTVLKMIAKTNDDYQVLVEPTDRWTEFHGHNLMMKIYEQENLSSIVQTFISVTIAEQHLAQTHEVKIMERSLGAARNLFIKYLHEKGIVGEVEKLILFELHAFLETTLNLKEPIYIFLDTPIEECIKRVERKADREQFFIDVDLLEGNERLTKEWKADLRIRGKKFYEIDGKLEVMEIQREIEFLIEYERLNKIYSENR